MDFRPLVIPLYSHNSLNYQRHVYLQLGCRPFTPFFFNLLHFLSSFTSFYFLVLPESQLINYHISKYCCLVIFLSPPVMYRSFCLFPLPVHIIPVLLTISLLDVFSITTMPIQVMCYLIISTALYTH